MNNNRLVLTIEVLIGGQVSQCAGFNYTIYLRLLGESAGSPPIQAHSLEMINARLRDESWSLECHV